MEVLKNMDEAELTALREQFEEADGALDIDQFKQVLSHWGEVKNVKLTASHLTELFSDIDINSDATVSWDEFTMYLITGESSANSGSAVKGYNLATTFYSEVPGTVTDIRPCIGLPGKPTNKFMKVIRRDNFGKVKLCVPGENATIALCGETPRFHDGVLSAEYIPKHKEVGHGNCFVVSSADSSVRLFDIDRRELDNPNVFLERKMFQFSESQNVLRWSRHHRRLFCGSRSGIVSTLNVDELLPSAKEKLHREGVSDMVMSRQQMFSCSVDGSLKVSDLSKGVVQHAVYHTSGLLKLAISVEQQFVVSSGFESSPTVYSISLPEKLQHRLQDKHRPHHGRIIGLEAPKGTPQIITADICGLVKIWDVRMYMCVQNINANKDDRNAHSATLSAIGVVPSTNWLIVHARDTKIFEYDSASNPHLSDDVAVTLLAYNQPVHSFLSVHHRTIKLWDAENGTLRGDYRHIVPSDITAVCIVPPRYRKMFVGTLSGDVFGLGYAVCSVYREFPQCWSMPSHVVKLVYLERIKDSHNPYLLIAFTKEIVLVPDIDEHVQRSSLSLHCITQALGRATITQVSSLHDTGNIVVGTNHGAVHLVDLATFTITATIQKSLVGDIQAICAMGIKAASNATLAFVSDGGGQIICTFQRTSTSSEHIASWPNAVTSSSELQVPAEATNGEEGPQYSMPSLPTSVQVTPRAAQLGSPSAPQPSLGGPTPPGTAPATGTGTFRMDSMISSETHTGGLPTAATGGTGKRPSVVPLGARPNSAVAGYFTQDRRIVFSSSIQCMFLIEPLRILVSADEKGNVMLWDIVCFVDFCEDLQHRAPISPKSVTAESILLRKWKAHEGAEVVSLTAYPGKTHNHWIIVTAGSDRQCLLWSLDGVCLGNLCQERAGALSTVARDFLPAGILPYVAERETPEDAWAETEAHVHDRDLPDEEPTPEDFPLEGGEDHRSFTSTVGGGTLGVLPSIGGLAPPSPFKIPRSPGRSGKYPSPMVTPTQQSFFLTDSMAFENLSGTGQMLPSLPTRFAGLVKPTFPHSESLSAREVTTAPLQPRGMIPQPPPHTARSSTIRREVSRDCAAQTHLLKRLAPTKKSFVAAQKRKLTKETRNYMRALEKSSDDASRLFLDASQRQFVEQGRVVLDKRKQEDTEPSTRAL